MPGNVRVSWKTKHGKHRLVPLYRSWHNMRNRCKGTTHDGRGNYRWKGLTYAWNDYIEFRDWALENGYSPRTCSLDRLDNTQGYSPENCEWVTRGENARRSNRKR